MLFSVLCLPGDQSHPFVQPTINPLACCICWTGLLGCAVFPPWNEGPNFGSYSPSLCGPMDCSPPSSCLYGILQARIIEWVAIPSSRRSSQPIDSNPRSLMTPALAGEFFTTSTAWETPFYYLCPSSSLLLIAVVESFHIVY